ncbi:MAG: LysM peptidoglycan-binding domain-containing protein [Verrucomicrobia bacterium]|nr:LysM peptidoglycan-binding domain-containing protein [Verrucomicrobiota bacterium]
MSIPNSPLLPGSKLEQAAKSKSTFSIAAFIFSAHVAVFLVVLLNGCNKESSATSTEPTAATNQIDLAVQPGAGVVDTNAPVQPPGLDSNTVATPPGGAVTFPGNLAANTNSTAQPIAPPDLGTSTPGGSSVHDTTGAGSEYKIKSGDIAYNIAKTHGVSLKALKDANPSVDLGKLKVGQTIQIPAGSASNTKAAATTVKADSSNEPAATGATTAYTVKGGDTLGKIAKKHGTTPKAIRAANGLSSDKINVGQKLKLPGKGAAAETTEPAVKTLAVPEPGAAFPTTLPTSGTGR